MKLKQIEAIIKKRKHITIYQDEEFQWFSDGIAAYPVFGLPSLSSADNILTMFDIPEEKRDEYTVLFSEKPDSISFADTDNGENQLEREDIAIAYDGMVLEPLKTTLGTVYINQKYLKPFADEDYLTLYERFDTSGKPYIVAKVGFTIMGLILPAILPEKFVSELESVYVNTALAYENNVGGEKK